MNQSAEVTLFLHGRDLRTDDNAGLSRAAQLGLPVLPLFIFDTNILDKLPSKKDRRITFIHQALEILQSSYEVLGGKLMVHHGDPLKIIEELCDAYPIRHVVRNTDYEPYAHLRDEQIKSFCESKGISFLAVRDHVIFEKREVVKASGDPYTVFTPYSRQWKAKLNLEQERLYSNSLQGFIPFNRFDTSVPTPESMGFESESSHIPDCKIALKTIDSYHQTRDIPSIPGTTRLSVHLRFGTVSTRKLVSVARDRNETWLNELIWREFYQMILWNFPHVSQSAFKPAYDKIPWVNDEACFKAWCNGQTGYPIVDAGMRELNETGFMHNRVRMITASFLTKHLLTDWRWGEAYFAEKLIDFDLASNNGGWQWAASSGCDAAPYFRIFNPESQTKKFDPDLKYIKKWVPELNTSKYPLPIVDYKEGRERALRVYKEALSN